MARALVTVQLSPTAQADLDLPWDVPFGELLWPIVSGLGWGTDSNFEVIHSQSDTIISPQSSLRDAGVLDGSLLFFKVTARSVDSLNNPIQAWEALDADPQTIEDTGPPTDDGFAWKECD